MAAAALDHGQPRKVREFACSAVAVYDCARAILRTLRRLRLIRSPDTG